MKKAILIALAAVALGACGSYKAEKMDGQEGCWVIDHDGGFTVSHEAIACEVEIER